MKKIVILAILTLLTSCGAQKDGGNTGPTTPRGGIEGPRLKDYVQLFTNRYSIPVNYVVEYDGDSATGGSGSAGTTVGVCRVYSDGYKEILINRSWWEDQQKYSQTLNLSNGNYSSNNKNFSFGDLEQRKNAEIKLVLNNGTSIVAENTITSSNSSFIIRPDSNKDLTANSLCSTTNGEQTCIVKVKFNLNENESLGSHSTTISNGDKTISINVNVVESPSAMYYGEISRKVLIYHEIGHCSLDRPHNSSQNTSLSPFPNRPDSMMFPTINNIVYWYARGYDVAYEEELINNREDLNASVSNSMLSMEYEEVTVDPHKDHGDCVQFIDVPKVD